MNSIKMIEFYNIIKSKRLFENYWILYYNIFSGEDYDKY